MAGTRPKKEIIEPRPKFLTVSHPHHNASLLTRSTRILTNAFCFQTEQGAFPYEDIIWKFYDKHTYALRINKVIYMLGVAVYWQDVF